MSRSLRTRLEKMEAGKPDALIVHGVLMRPPTFVEIHALAEFELSGGVYRHPDNYETSPRWKLWRELVASALADDDEQIDERTKT